MKRFIASHELSLNVAELIPYKSFWEKINVVKQELSKGRKVEVMLKEKMVYSTARWEEVKKFNEQIL